MRTIHARLPRQSTAASGARAPWRAVVWVAAVCVAFGAWSPAPASAQVVAAGVVLLCIALLMRHRERSSRDPRRFESAVTIRKE
jgi:Flp pilus assembly protein TadB